MIHQYINNGYFIVLDVNSGSVHVVDEQAYRIIPMVEELLQQKIEEKTEIADKVAQKLSGEDRKEISAAMIEETVEEILELKEKRNAITIAGKCFIVRSFRKKHGRWQRRIFLSVCCRHGSMHSGRLTPFIFRRNGIRVCRMWSS